MTLTPTEYVYSGGMETGAVIRIINYPRFPAEEFHVWDRAVRMAYDLMAHLYQKTCTVRGTDDTVYLKSPHWAEGRV